MLAMGDDMAELLAEQDRILAMPGRLAWVKLARLNRTAKILRGNTRCSNPGHSGSGSGAAVTRLRALVGRLVVGKPQVLYLVGELPSFVFATAGLARSPRPRSTRRRNLRSWASSVPMRSAARCTSIVPPIRM